MLLQPIHESIFRKWEVGTRTSCVPLFFPCFFQEVAGPGAGSRASTTGRKGYFNNFFLTLAPVFHEGDGTSRPQPDQAGSEPEMRPASGRRFSRVLQPGSFYFYACRPRSCADSKGFGWRCRRPKKIWTYKRFRAGGQQSSRAALQLTKLSSLIRRSMVVFPSVAA